MTQIVTTTMNHSEAFFPSPHQVDALVQLVQHFGWSWVGVIAGDDAYGRGGANIFADEVSYRFLVIS